MIAKAKKFLGIKDHNSSNFIVWSLVLIFFAGLLSLWIRQPMTWLDEPSHYARSIQIAHGDIIKVSHGDFSKVGGRISITQEEFIERAWDHSKNPPLNPNWYGNYRDLNYSDKQMFRVATNAIPYTPFVYSPYILIASINNMLKLPVSLEYQLMRLTGFILFFVIFLLSIKKTPIGKLPMTMIGLIPTVLITWTSVSADGFSLVVSLLFTSIILSLYYKLAYDEEINLQDILELSIATLLVSLSKIPIFVILFLLLPWMIIAFFKGNIRKKEIFIELFVVLFSTLFFIWWFLSIKDINTGAYFNRNVDTAKQLAYIMDDIPRFFNILWTSILNYNFVEFQLGYINTNINTPPVPTILTIIYFIGVVLATIFETSETSNQEKNKNTSLILFWLSFSKVIVIFLYTFLVFLSLYLQFSEVGTNQILGVQPRYFMPLYGLLFSFGFRSKRSLKPLDYLFSILTLSPMVYYILILVSCFY